MSAIWVMDIPKKVFSRVTTDFPENLKKKYKMQKVTAGLETRWLNFSDSTVSDKKPVFPYITVVNMPGQERGRDLEGNTINAAYFSFQVEVYDNAKEANAKECMAAIMDIFKSMMFEAKPIPSFDSKPQEYRMTARFSRTISQNDLV